MEKQQDGGLLDFASVDNILRLALSPPEAPVLPEQQQFDSTQPYEAPPQLNLNGAPTLPFMGMAPGGITQPRQPGPLVPLPNYTGAPVQSPVQLSPQDIDLFTGAIRYVETRGHKTPYQAKNPNSTASGAYQYLNGTWNGYGGYAEARLAPKHVQDARFREDAIRSLRKFNGDPFKMIANHMLPVQANQPWLWEHPSTQVVGRGNNRRTVQIPPVADYVRTALKNTPWAGQFNQYMQAYRQQR